MASALIGACDIVVEEGSGGYKQLTFIVHKTMLTELRSNRNWELMVIYLLSLAIFDFHSQLAEAVGLKANKFWAFILEDCSNILNYMAQPANYC